jgi:glycosyltransferase involved in cell wall biosynthesis
MMIEKKFKILHICSYSWEIGGPPSVIFNLSNSFKNLVESDIASTIASNHTLYSIYPGQRVFVFQKSFFSKIIPDFSFKLFFWFLNNLRHYEFIVVHGLWNIGSILAIFLTKRSRIILTVHGFLDPYVLEKSRFKKKIYWFLFQKYCFKKASIIHAISSEEEILLKELFPNFINKIKFIPNGINDPLILNTPIIPSNGFKLLVDKFLSNSEYTFLYIGRINKKKGIDLIFESFYNLVEKVESKTIKLIIAGPIDNYNIEFKELQERFQHTNILILPSVISVEKNYLFSKVNSFLLPSYSEGFSIAALEAISYGKSCIFSENIGFSIEALKNDSVLICDLNVESLAEKMSLLINDIDLNVFLSKNSRNFFSMNYQIDDIAQRYYNEIILSNE